ncbi:hypothetical protein PybrP1_002487 [[Pythium] brassicae (nom. inval.)]|nr:hypothetical protein PybrP1_002487 [[Pythium] brassicae (nom. inval.)]
MVSGGGKRAQDRRRREPQAALRRAQLPAARTLVWHSSLHAAKSRHSELLGGLALAQQLEVVVPGAAGVAFAQTLQWDTSFFYEVTAPLALLLSRRFVRDYVLQGAVSMIAKNVPVDGANSAMLLPSGELLLLVDADTYAQLGIVGRKYGGAVPAACRPSAARYVVAIDLKTKAFAGDADGDAGSERDRVVRCLETAFAPLEMLVCAVNERGAARTLLFGDDDTVERKRVEVNGGVTLFQDVVLPQLQLFGSRVPAPTTSDNDNDNDATAAAAAQMTRDALLASLQEAYDWMGLVACRLTELLQHKSPEAYVSTFTGPRADALPFAPVASELAAVRWRGLVATDFRRSVVDKAAQAVKRRQVPWAVVMAWGFPDALASWTQKSGTERREHGFLVSGSNHYTLLLLPNDEYILLQALGPHDATV